MCDTWGVHEWYLGDHAWKAPGSSPEDILRWPCFLTQSRCESNLCSVVFCLWVVFSMLFFSIPFVHSWFYWFIYLFIVLHPHSSVVSSCHFISLNRFLTLLLWSSSFICYICYWHLWQSILYQAIKSSDELEHCKARAELFSASLLAERLVSALWAGNWQMQGNSSTGWDYSPPSLFSAAPGSVHPSFLHFTAAFKCAWQWRNCYCSS